MKAQVLFTFALVTAAIFLAGCASAPPVSYTKPTAPPSSVPGTCSQPWVPANGKDEWVCPPAPQRQSVVGYYYAPYTPYFVPYYGLGFRLCIGCGRRHRY